MAQETAVGPTEKLLDDEKLAHSSCLATKSSDSGVDFSSPHTNPGKQSLPKIRDGQEKSKNEHGNPS